MCMSAGTSTRCIHAIHGRLHAVRRGPDSLPVRIALNKYTYIHNDTDVCVQAAFPASFSSPE